jgi:1,5-anhydro-D-fructose reductase (1,5-anhydro-D-mannitol-forming)
MQINWGIIGCGDVTEVKSGPGFQQVENSRLVAVMRRDADKARDFAERHGVPVWTTKAEEVIDHPDVNAVYIATPPGSHLSYALQVCAAGKPAYVEKPMARSAAECRAMTDAFDRAGLPLFVAYYRRALPRFLKAKELVESGRIGRVTGVTYRFANSSHRRLDPGALPWRWIAEEAGGGQFLDLGCHTLDILDFILGPLEDVKGDAVNLSSPCDVEDAVAMQFRLQSGGLGTASWNFASDRRIDLIEIAGTEAEIALSTFGDEPVTVSRGAEQETFDLPNPRHIQQPFIETIVRQLNGDGSCPSTGVTATRTAQVMDTVLDRYYGGRSDAFWTRPVTWPGRCERVG